MADFPLTRWRLLGLGILASLPLLMPWMAPMGSHEFRILLIVPFATVAAGGTMLLFFKRPEALPDPMLRAEPPQSYRPPRRPF